MSSHRLRDGRRSIIGQSYILTWACHERHHCFDDPVAAQIVMAQLSAPPTQLLVESLAWVVMPDHVHWLFELRFRTLGHIAQRVKSSTALRINRECAHHGPVWQSCYHDHAVRSDESLHRHAMYIVANPVRAGLSSRIGEYPFAWCRWLGNGGRDEGASA